MDLATAPRPAFGVTLDAGVRISWFSVAGEFRLDPPAGGAGMATAVQVSATRILGALVPCGHVGWFAACLIGELGQIRGSVGEAGAAQAAPDTQSALYLAAGVRAAVEIPIVPERLFARVAGDVAGTRPAALRLNGRPQWETGSVVGGIGTGLLAAF